MSPDVLDINSKALRALGLIPRHRGAAGGMTGPLDAAAPRNAVDVLPLLGTWQITGSEGTEARRGEAIATASARRPGSVPRRRRSAWQRLYRRLAVSDGFWLGLVTALILLAAAFSGR